MDAIRLLQHAKCTRKHRDRRGAWASRGSYLRFEDRSSSISGAEMQRCGWVKIAVHGTIGVCVEWPSPLGKFNDRLPLHCSTAPRHHLTHCTSEPANQRSLQTTEAESHWTTERRSRMLRFGQFELYRRQQFAVTCELPEKPLQIADRSGSQNPRHASVLITTKNNDRLRLLEAIWPATFSLRRTALVFIYPFMIFLYIFFRCCLINRSKFIGWLKVIAL